MKSQLFIICFLYTFHVSSQNNSEVGIFDTSGNRVYYTKDSDQKHEVKMSNGRKAMYTEQLLINESGRTYKYDYKWEQIISNDIVIMNYNFNLLLVQDSNFPINCREIDHLVRLAGNGQNFGFIFILQFKHIHNY